MLEEIVFINQIVFGVIFMIIAYIFKFNSIWNDSKSAYRKLDKQTFVVDVWFKKGTSDFFHYLKFEYF